MLPLIELHISRRFGLKGFQQLALPTSKAIGAFHEATVSQSRQGSGQI